MKKIYLVALMTFLLLVGLNAQLRKAYVETEGARTYYQVFGTGTVTLLIINGGPGMNSQGFGSLAQQLADRYTIRTIIYDQRGTGNSTVNNAASITLKAMLSDIEAIREAERIQEWMVFGQSFGGMLAAYYTSEYPDKVSKLILSSSGGMNLRDLDEVDVLGRLTRAERDSFNYWNQRLQTANDSKTLYRRNTFLAAAYLVDSLHLPQIASRLGEVNWNINRIVYQDLRRTGFDCTEKLKTFQNPVLIFVGEQDVVSIHAARRAHQLLQNSALVVIPRCGHYGWLDNPVVYFEALDRFMGS